MSCRTTVAKTMQDEINADHSRLNEQDIDDDDDAFNEEEEFEAYVI